MTAPLTRAPSLLPLLLPLLLLLPLRLPYPTPTPTYFYSHGYPSPFCFTPEQEGSPIERQTCERVDADIALKKG